MTKALTYVRNFEANVKYFKELCENRIKELDERPYTTDELEDEKAMHEQTIEKCEEKLKDFYRMCYVTKQVNYLMENEPKCMFMYRIGA